MSAMHRMRTELRGDEVLKDSVLYGYVFPENGKWCAFGAQYEGAKGFDYLGHHPTEQEALSALRAWVKGKTEEDDLCWIKEEEVRPTIGRISKYTHLEDLPPRKRSLSSLELEEEVSNIVSDVKAELERLESNYGMVIEGYDDKIKALEAKVLVLEKRVSNMDNPHSVRTLREDE